MSINYKVIINGTKEIVIEPSELSKTDLTRLNENEYHIIDQHKSYHAEIVEIDTANKTIKMFINDSLVKCSIQDNIDMLLERLDLSVGVIEENKDLVSSMPGLVREVSVIEGQPVKEGDHLMILEAMKMENILKASTDGIVHKIHIKKNESVDKHQLLIEIQ